MFLHVNAIVAMIFCFYNGGGGCNRNFINIMDEYVLHFSIFVLFLFF